jgi:uncharacterized membrane protein YoaK (UPF0700 family)
VTDSHGRDGAGPAAPVSTVLVVLTGLTVVSGLVDAASYLGLGRVFAANMTGNVVVLGFAAAGAPGFSVPATLTSLGAFLVGAVVAGRVLRHGGSRRRVLIVAVTTEGCFTSAAAIVAFVAPTVATGWGRFTVIGLLGFAMGVRNATVRGLAVPDVTTTVLTMTLTGLAADSSLAGGTNPRAGRRSFAVAAMLVGATAGAAMELHQSVGLPLLVAGILALAAAVTLTVTPSVRSLDP